MKLLLDFFENIIYTVSITMKQEVHMDRARRKFLVGLANECVVGSTEWQRGPYTHVRVTVRIETYWVEGHGFSKCRPGDTWSGAEGIAKARARAILDAAQQMNLMEV